VDHDERDLVRQCLDGNQDACTSLVQEYARLVGTVIWRAIGDHDAVEDLAQETFLRVFRGLPYFDARSKLSTWICTIAHRVAIDHTRQRHVQAAGLEPPDAPDALQRDPESAAAHDELDRIVRGQLTTLPDKYRLPLVYATLDELDYQTIAVMLKVKPGTVKTLVFRARQMLKERVEAVLAERRARTHAT
jgi:RNA polymerase sigma-70 factor (ECF subfamily)